MKRILTIAVVLFPWIASAQDEITLDQLMHLDFQVPDNPAFKSLGIDPSEILRPNEIKDLAMLVAPGLSSNLAIEWSPGRVRSKHWTRNDYQTSGIKRFWANSAFSLGTQLDKAEAALRPFQLSAGYRFQLLSKEADPLRNDILEAREEGRIRAMSALRRYYVRNVMPADTTIEISYADKPDPAATMFKVTRTRPCQTCPTGMAVDTVYMTVDTIVSRRCPTEASCLTLLIAPPDGLEQDSIAFMEWVEAVLPKNLPEELVVMLDSARTPFSDILSDFRSSTWNARKFDFAIALSGDSQDSTLEGLSYRALHFWATLGVPLGNRGQLLLGANFANTLDPDSLGLTQMITGNLRAYYGSERLKMFLEAQFKNTTYDRETDPNPSALLVNLGLEARIVGNFGVVASTGVENYLDAEPDVVSAFRSNLDFRYYFR